MTKGSIHGLSPSASKARLQDFARSVGHHYLECPPWRRFVDAKVLERVSDCFILHGRESSYGFFFCPWCSCQVVLLKANMSGIRGVFVEGVEDDGAC